MITIKIKKFLVQNACLAIEVKLEGCAYSKRVHSPKIAVCFQRKDYIRRIPLEILSHTKRENGLAMVLAGQEFVLDHLFEIGEKPDEFTVWFALQYGNLELEPVPFQWKNLGKSECLLVESSQDQQKMTVKWNLQSDSVEEVQLVSEHNRKPEAFLSKVNRHLFREMFRLFSKRKIQKDKVFFLSNRRNDLTGNMYYVQEELKEMPVKIKYLLKDCDMKEFHPLYFWRAAWNVATSGVVLVDDSCNFLDFINLKEETSLIQLWHACGAFKTFGYSRLGKSEGPDQRDRNHRFYRHAITSSSEIGKFYAEAFGIPMNHVSPTGVPRTDIFFDPKVKTAKAEQFYQKYPEFQGKKIILFAPTFRGWDKESAYYPLEQFDAVEVLKQLGDEYRMIIKYHPYIDMRYPIPDAWKNRMIDLTEEAEINDLLFVTDLVITDYSSVIFEASLLDIPMLFYAYDLEEYISARDFYYEFEDFVPGRIVRSQEELVEAIHEQSFEQEKIPAFKQRFFDYLDGKSAKRVAELVYQDVKGEVWR